MLEVLALRFIAPDTPWSNFGKSKHAKIHDFLELSRFTDEAFICRRKRGLWSRNAGEARHFWCWDEDDLIWEPATVHHQIDNDGSGISVAKTPF